MSQHTEDGARYRRARRAFLQANPYCWICGHPGADTVDHAIPRSVRRTKLEITNWRAAHGVKGCTHCPPKADGRPARCNQDRGTKPVESMIKTFTPNIDW